jgi:hypothetical protein
LFRITLYVFFEAFVQDKSLVLLEKTTWFLLLRPDRDNRSFLSLKLEPVFFFIHGRIERFRSGSLDNYFLETSLLLALEHFCIPSAVVLPRAVWKTFANQEAPFLKYLQPLELNSPPIKDDLRESILTISRHLKFLVFWVPCNRPHIQYRTFLFRLSGITSIIQAQNLR